MPNREFQRSIIYSGEQAGFSRFGEKTTIMIRSPGMVILFDIDGTLIDQLLNR